jgi:pimeloyl-ACP methyl ester carboxylesterase
MARVTLPTGIEIEYEEFGTRADPTVLLVSGFTSQLLGWDEGFCRELASRGRHVIRFDNRDVGLSTHLDGQLVNMKAARDAAFFGGDPIDPPYTLSDMAADGLGLVDALECEIVDVVGMSMGGMIVQTMAIDRPERIRSVVSVMSTTGARDVGQPTPEALERLLTAPPSNRDEYIEASVGAEIWSSKRYFDPQRAREKAAASYDRMFYPEGPTRQYAAIMASGDRTEALRSVEVPMLVIHGNDDTLIHPSGGEATAAVVPGAKLLMLDDMGHDIPEPLWPEIAGAIVDFGDSV